MASTFIQPDMEPSALESWQLLKTPTVAQSALLAGRLSRNVHDVNGSPECLDVSPFGAIRFQIWGEGDNNDVPVIDLYGWQHSGPGVHMGTVTLAMGNFTVVPGQPTKEVFDDAFTHKSIKDAFGSTATYRGCDTYTLTNDFDGGISVSAAQEADFPGVGVDVSFASSQYKWFSVMVTNLGTPAATNVGAIFKALSVKKGYSSPQFTG